MMKTTIFSLIALLWLVPGSASAQLEWRVSVKFILDEDGNRPAGGVPGGLDLTTNREIEDQVAWANDLLSQWSRGYQIDLTEILDVDDAPEWFERNARNFYNKTELDLKAKLEPNRFHYRSNAINVYVNNSDASGYCSRPGSGQVIMMGQGAREASFFHEVGHFFDLCHTQGCLCGGCEEDDNVPIIGDIIDQLWLPCDVIPGDDNVPDTLPDIACWDQDDIASNSFGQNYLQLGNRQQDQVDDVFFNLMSYHATRNRLTLDQMDLMTDASNTSRIGVATGRTIFVDKDALGILPTGNSGAPFEKIKNALEDASAGDILLIRAGTYTDKTTIRKKVTLRATRGNAVLRSS